MGKFVSRAGEKLQFGLDTFNIFLKGKTVADFGSSTGGFVDCLLQNGVKKVFAVDTAYGELDWNIRNDPRVVVLERTNAMHVKLPEKVDFISIDVGWTKQEKVLPNAFGSLREGGVLVSLVKPHYEAKDYMLSDGKLVNKFVDEVVGSVKDSIQESGGKLKGFIQSPLLGDKGGNIEFLALIQK